MLLLSVFVFVMIGVWRYAENLTGKGLTADIILEFFGYIAITTIPMALPLAILLASIMVFGNLGEHYELTAIKSSGVSLSRIMSPLIFITIILAICAFYFSNNILPVTNKKAKTLMWDIQKQNPTFSLQEGIFNHNLPGWSIKANRIDNKSNTLYDIIIYQHQTTKKNPITIIAEKGIINNSKNIRFLNFTLYNGAYYSENTRKKNFPFKRAEFKKYVFPIELPNIDFERSDGEHFKGEYKMLNVRQLTYMKDSLLVIFQNIKNNYAKDLNKKRYLKNYRKKSFSSKDKSSVENLNMIPVFDDLPLHEKQIVVSSAHNDAKNILKANENSISLFFQWKRWIKMYDIYKHNKFTFALTCIIFFFVGAPLGSIIRKGGIGMPVIVSIVLFIIYHILTKTTENKMKTGDLNVILGSWLPFLIFLPLGILLTYKATTDSTLFNAEYYWKIFQKIKSIKFDFKKNSLS